MRENATFYPAVFLLLFSFIFLKKIFCFFCKEKNKENSVFIGIFLDFNFSKKSFKNELKKFFKKSVDF